MSATLGPIHYRMYGRILLQDQLVLGILHLAEVEGWKLDLPADLPSPLVVDDVANIVDSTNIHGWLNGRVIEVEKRLAAVLTAVLANDAESRLSKLESLFYETGLQYKIQLQAPEYTAKTIYELVHYYLLDGMPCDFPFKALEEGSDSLYRWEVVACPHAQYYASNPQLLQEYYQLRVSFVRGLLVDIPVTYSWNEINEFVIQKQERG